MSFLILLGVALVVSASLAAFEIRRVDRRRASGWEVRSFATSTDLRIDNLRTMYFEGSIEADEFEAKLWQVLTGASSPELIAEAEAIASEKPQKDEVFQIMIAAHQKRIVANQARLTPAQQESVQRGGS